MRGRLILLEVKIRGASLEGSPWESKRDRTPKGLNVNKQDSVFTLKHFFHLNLLHLILLSIKS